MTRKVEAFFASDVNFGGIMARRKPEVLEGFYTVKITDALRATAVSDPAKWSIWDKIWNSESFEQLARRCPDPVQTSRTNRKITWRSEVRWALRQGWIRKGESKPGNQSE